jgi:hypothetical protein
MVVVMLILLMLGLGFGSAFFPRIVAQTSKQTTSQLYQLEFVQESNCPYGSWLFPWAVVLDNSTVVVQPSNATLPLTYGGTHLTSDSNYSTIVFSVPDGTYNYTVVPNDPFNPEQSGNVTVDGSDVQVQVGEYITAMGCSSTTTTTSSTSTHTATILVATTITIVSTISGTVTTITTTIPGTAATITSSTGLSSGLLYGVAAVAVIFIIATSYLAMRGRKPAS